MTPSLDSKRHLDEELVEGLLGSSCRRGLRHGEGYSVDLIDERR